jgi:2,4-dienoyl-CoA reductase-like NADH-dependent reductase (Old Yellow Enzyme family)
MDTLPRTERVAPLLAPYRLNDTLALKNRIVVSPCTRNRADLPGWLPTAGAVPYYAARADAGLIVTEATMIGAYCQGYRDTPGIWSAAQVARWQRVTEAVHARGGVIFTQLWHTGRLAHSYFTHEPPVCPSPVPTYLEPRSTRGMPLPHETPRALSSDEIRAAIDAYAHAARNAHAAGFDGVELHGGNGYLIEQFLRQHTNRRTDEWGGTAANRIRFALDAVDAVAEVLGPSRVGIRLSPAAYFGDMNYVASDEDAYIGLLEALSRRGLAYVHLAIVVDAIYDYLRGRSSAFLRRHYTGTVIGNGGYTPEQAAVAVAAGRFDLASFGKLFIANPDLVARLRAGAPLRQYDYAMTHAFE